MNYIFELLGIAASVLIIVILILIACNLAKVEVTIEDEDK